MVLKVSSRKFACPVLFFLLLLTPFSTQVSFALQQPNFGLQEQLTKEPAANLAKAARALGDATRGAVVFYQPYLSCSKCHEVGGDSLLGPDLTQPREGLTDAAIVEAVLHPSKEIRKGFETTNIVTLDGVAISGILVKRTDDELQIKEVGSVGKPTTISLDEIDEEAISKLSIMPQGQVSQLASRQQFLDVIKYLIEINEGGLARARDLKPDPSLYAVKPLPEYEAKIDHQGLINGLDRESYKRGEKIYNRLCINCHGTANKPGSLPTSLKFASGKFKNGNDPHAMYQTLTRGFGMMVAQSWMVPQQKYDVIHYIREEYLKKHNQSQLFAINDNYLSGLPKGDTFGPEPSNIEVWSNMDYGPSLIGTYEIGRRSGNFAYKGIAVRLDEGQGGIARGNRFAVFEHDTMRLAAAWSGEGFIDWESIIFNGKHNIHPATVGNVLFQNQNGPGWANPDTGSFADPRSQGRDGLYYGPLPRNWAHYNGMYHFGSRTVIDYNIGSTKVLESHQLLGADSQPVVARVLNIGPRDKAMTMQVVNESGSSLSKIHVKNSDLQQGIHFAAGDAKPSGNTRRPAATFNGEANFKGNAKVEINKSADFDMTDGDYTIFAKIRTKQDGTIVSKASKLGEWKPNGKTFFVRGGRLGFDIGWVGAVAGKTTLKKNAWHEVALTWNRSDGKVSLYLDGKLDGQGTLSPKAKTKNDVLRIGYTSKGFPSESFFNGNISSVKFYQRLFNAAEVAQISKRTQPDPKLIGSWDLSNLAAGNVKDQTDNQHAGVATLGDIQPQVKAGANFVAALNGTVPGAKWQDDGQGNLRLHIPAGDEPLQFALLMTKVSDASAASRAFAKTVATDIELDLQTMTQGGPPRWAQEIKTTGLVGTTEGPFAVDVLTRPANNPWFARVRLTGLDFLPGDDSAVLSAWDGDIWEVHGLANVANGLTWKRIASGLFQPLGIKLVEGKIYVTCRDQLVILNDLNGDGEIDHFESFNSDHQVTPHFHEFAMGLQVDDAGNFYYAKSARHALTAVVPHHGTLLRVSKDGSKTDIVANGFRAANGVCINPDGTFIVTDQEGHWNPKNRINWVREGGFYGNMYGYHDVTDSSDSAMEQPLCWITNSFDRSPSELLWVDSEKWGPLSGQLLNFSYGFGKVYVVPHETVNGQVQGGMCEFPLPRFPTGVMRGRFHPQDGQLYTCGMFAWAGNQTQPGGFYRIRYTGKPVLLPVKLEAKKAGMRIAFSTSLNKMTASDVRNWSVKTWSLKRTKEYGSKHYDEKQLKINEVVVSKDGKSVMLFLPAIEPTWCMEINYTVETADGKSITGKINNTIHNLQ